MNPNYIWRLPRKYDPALYDSVHRFPPRVGGWPSELRQAGFESETPGNSRQFVSGRRLVMGDEVLKSDEEWRQLPTPEQYRDAREKGNVD